MDRLININDRDLILDILKKEISTNLLNTDYPKEKLNDALLRMYNLFKEKKIKDKPQFYSIYWIKKMGLTKSIKESNNKKVFNA